MAHDLDTIGARVRFARQARKLSQRELGEAIGAPDHRRIHFIETNAERHKLRAEEAVAIADATGVTTDFLLHGWQDGNGAPPLEQRIRALERGMGALEGEIRKARADRDRQAAEIKEIYGILRTRYTELVSRTRAQDQQQGTSADRRQGGDRRAP